MDAKQARHVLIGLLETVQNQQEHPTDWNHVASLVAQYTRRLGVRHAVINEARTMTVEELVLTALGVNEDEPAGTSLAPFLDLSGSEGDRP